jgi:hypothetical protein
MSDSVDVPVIVKAISHFQYILQDDSYLPFELTTYSGNMIRMCLSLIGPLSSYALICQVEYSNRFPD